MPDAPSERIGWSRPSQPLKSPTTLTERGVRRPDREGDAGDAVDHAGVRAEPRVQLLVPPSPARWTSSSPSVGRNAYGSRTTYESPAG